MVSENISGPNEIPPRGLLDFWIQAADLAITPFIVTICSSIVGLASMTLGTARFGKLAFYGYAFFYLAAVFTRFYREFVANWREYPYYLDGSDADRRVISTAAPILLAAACLSLFAFASPVGPYIPNRSISLLVLFILIVEIPARRFGEKAARILREIFAKPNDAASSTRTAPLNIAPRAASPLGVEPSSDETTIASQTRVRRADGAEKITGEATTDVQENEETAVVFISFCPPFDATPTFEYEQTDGDEYVWQAPVVRSFGVRLVGKRPAGGAANAPRIEYYAAAGNWD